MASATGMTCFRFLQLIFLVLLCPRLAKASIDNPFHSGAKALIVIGTLIPIVCILWVAICSYVLVKLCCPSCTRQARHLDEVRPRIWRLNSNSVQPAASSGPVPSSLAGPNIDVERGDGIIYNAHGIDRRNPRMFENLVVLRSPLDPSLATNYYPMPSFYPSSDLPPYSAYSLEQPPPAYSLEQHLPAYGSEQPNLGGGAVTLSEDTRAQPEEIAIHSSYQQTAV